MSRRRPGPPDRALIAYLAEAMEPGERARMAARLRREPRLRERLERLQPRSAPAWRLPAAPFAGPLQGWQRNDLLGTPTAPSDPIQPGAGLSVHVAPLSDPEAWEVVLLEWDGQGWAVTSPRGPEDVLTLAQLPEQPDGTREILLTAPVEPGPFRWAVALRPAATPVDFAAAEPWAETLLAIAEGAAPLLLIAGTVG